MNMTIEEYGQGKWTESEEDRRYMVSVQDHKTAKTYQAAKVAICEETKLLTDNFLELCRPILIWKGKRKNKMPLAVSRDNEAAFNWKISRPMETNPRDPIFVSNNNVPLKR